jgi:hypothetical protein
VRENDYLMAIEDIRDGGIHLIRTPGDLGRWLVSFKEGGCERGGLRGAPRRRIDGTGRWETALKEVGAYNI